MSDSSRIGSVIASKYRLEEELGRGGMGAVYRARHTGVHKEFAIKLLLGELTQRESMVSRFLLEAQAAGRIGHPGILDVYDVGAEPDGTPYLVMELLTGEPLSALVKRGPLEIDAACWIAMEILEVLAAAHQAGIIHRDVKPQNVFLTERTAPSGRPSSGAGPTRGIKLLDFGIAKFTASDVTALTRSGEIIGSPLYMAPEQAKGEQKVDARADVWSVGAMLFEMLTGKCAHAATTPVAVLAKILTEPTPPVGSRREGIPAELESIVARALEIDRDRRWASAREMHDALAEVRRAQGTADVVPSLPPARRSDPPSSTDTGAISSTVGVAPPISSTIALSDAPLQAASGGGNAVSTSDVPARWRTIAAAGGALVGVVLAVAWMSSSGNDAHGGREPAGSVGAQMSAVVSVTAAAAPIPSPSATPQAIESVAKVASTDAGPPPATTASTSAPLHLPAARPKCEAGEILSKGHCCPRGFEWRDGRCERPLAETF